MTTPQPTAGHGRLVRFVGTWSGTENMLPSHWDKDGFTALGRNTCRLALNGFAMIVDYEQVRDGEVAFTGHGVLTYDERTDQYQMTWFDCLGTAPEMFIGKFVGEVLTLISDRGEARARLTYDFSREGIWRGQMEMSTDGKFWNTLFEAEYTRG